MPHIAANDLELYYEVAGDPTDPPILLIAGLGTQIVAWSPVLLDALIESGHYVIAYDNRDIGLSSTFEDGPSDPEPVMEAMLSEAVPDVAYTLADMADDAADLLVALGIESAHVVGISMGGMIAHLVAIRHPNKVRSLTSVMSSTGALDVGQPTPEAMEAIMSRGPVAERDEAIAHNVNTAKLWASPEHFDAQRLHEVFSSQWDRVGGSQAANTGRHFCAIIATPSREDALAGVEVPTLVIHGTEDTLISASGGERTASIIAGAKLMLIEGMGHDMPPPFAARVAKAVGELVSIAT